MRKLIVSNLVSLDGYIAGPDGDLSWFTVGPEFFAYANELMGNVSAILFGRVTYEMMRDYWTSPGAGNENDAVVVKNMNELPKHVFSRTLKKAGWGKWDNATAHADPVATVTKLKSTADGDMVIFGSGGLVSALTPHGLIDEYRMIVNPSILGQGTPMFRGLRERVALKLTGSRRFDGDVVMLTYQPEKH